MATRTALPAALVALFAAMAAGQSSSGNPLNDFISQAGVAASAISAANSATATPSSTLATSTTSATPTATSSAAAAPASAGLSQGAIIAIAVVAVVAVLVLLGFLVGCCLLRRRRRRQRDEATVGRTMTEKPRGRRRGCLPCLCCKGRGRTKPRMATPDSDVIDRRGWKRNSPPHGGFVDHPEALNSDALQNGHYPPMAETGHGHDHHRAGSTVTGTTLGAAAHPHPARHSDGLHDGRYPRLHAAPSEKEHGHADHHHPGAGTAAGAALGAGAVGAAAHHHRRSRPDDAEHPAYRHSRSVSPANVNAENPFTPPPPVARKPVPSPTRTPRAGMSHSPALSPVRPDAAHAPDSASPHGTHHGMGTAAAAAAGGVALGAVALGAGAMHHHHQRRDGHSRSRSRSAGRTAHHDPRPLGSHPSNGDFHAPGGAAVDEDPAGAAPAPRNRPPTPLGLAQFGPPAPARSPNRPHPTLDTAAAAGTTGAPGAGLAQHQHGRDRSYSPDRVQRSPGGAAAPDLAGVPAPTATQRRSLHSRDANPARPAASPRRSSTPAARDARPGSPRATNYSNPASPARAATTAQHYAPSAALANGNGNGRAAHASPHDSAYVSNEGSSSGESFHSASQQSQSQSQAYHAPPSPRNTAYRRSYPERPDDVGTPPPQHDFAPPPPMPVAEEGSSSRASSRHRYSTGTALRDDSTYGSGPGAPWMADAERRGSWGSSGGRRSADHARGGSKSPRRSFGPDGKPRRLRFSDVGPEQWRCDERGPVGQAM